MIVWMAEFNDKWRVVNITKFWLNIFDWLLTKARNKSCWEMKLTMSANIFSFKNNVMVKAQLCTLEDERLGDYRSPN